MKIIAHRGLWTEKDQSNTRSSLGRAFVSGFGVETDFRDCDGRIVISHDPPRRGAFSLEDLVRLWRERAPAASLALNVKSDGLATLVCSFFSKEDYNRVFFFDMSVPDAVAYLRHGLPVYTRMSEFEQHSPFWDDARGVWLDAFMSSWYTEHVGFSIRATGK